MIKCPQCGHEWSNSEYHGHLRHHIPLIEMLHKSGKHPHEIAAFLNEQESFKYWPTTGQKVRYALKKLGFQLPIPPVIEYTKRNKAIVEARKAGLTLKEIGHQFNLSKDRIRTICITAQAKRCF